MELNNGESTELGQEAPALPLARLTKAEKVIVQGMTTMMAGDMVRGYYAMQENRLRIASHIREAEKRDEDTAVISSVLEAARVAESRAANTLDAWSATQPLGAWARECKGVGPIIAAGLLSQIDVERAKHVSSVWRFAGLDPTAVWKKGEKRPHNAFLKVLCWKLGDSFVKVSGREGSVYGRIYKDAKAEYVLRNQRGDYAEQAAAKLQSKKINDAALRARLESGRLPDGQIDLRARRKAVKVFLNHYWIKGRALQGLPVDDPWIIGHDGHSHFIQPEVPF